jgi:hypothetical protein
MLAERGKSLAVRETVPATGRALHPLPSEFSKFCPGRPRILTKISKIRDHQLEELLRAEKNVEATTT